LTIQFSGSAAAIRNASAKAMESLKAISEGTISKEDFTKAVALAKYQALEEGQNIEAGLVSTGAGLVHGGKPFQIDEVGKSLVSVTVEKVKLVCDCFFSFLAHISIIISNQITGSQGSFGRQGNCLGCGRSLHSAICGRNRAQGVKDWKGLGCRRGLYQQLIECTVDIRAILLFNESHPSNFVKHCNFCSTSVEKLW
jgi:hypothetical protein